MSKKLTIIVLTLSISLAALHSADAQTIEISPSYGYQFGTKLDYPLGYIKLKDSDFLGVTLGYGLSPRFMIEFGYVNMGTELLIRDRDFSPLENRLSDISLDILQIGGKRYLKGGKVQPYLGGALGLAIFSPKNENRDLIDFNLASSTRFSLSFKAGVLLNLSERVGIKFQGDLFVPVEWGGIYVGGGSGGVSSGVNLGGSTVIVGINGGLVFKLGV